MTIELEPTQAHGSGGPARGYSWPTATAGNLLAAKSQFWVDPTLREDHRTELEAITEALIAELPYDPGPFMLAIDQLARRLWRQRRAYIDLDDNGLLRDGKPAPVLDHLTKLEAAIMRDLDALGLTPRSASDLIEAARVRDPFAPLEAHLRAKKETTG